MVMRVDVVDAALRGRLRRRPAGAADRPADARRAGSSTRRSPPSSPPSRDAGAALRPLRGRRRARPRAPRRPTRSRSAATCSPAASSRRWSSPTRCCASSPARSATPTARSRSRSPRRSRARPSTRTTRARPSYRGWDVPEVLLSGDHARVREWRLERSRERGGASGASSRRRSSGDVVATIPHGLARAVIDRQPAAVSIMSTIIESIEQHQLQQRPALRRRRPRARPLPGHRGHPHAHPGLRGHRDQAPGQRRPRDVHRPQAVVRRRRRADVPRALAQDRAARGRRPRRRAPGEALLPARPRRQARPRRRAPLGHRGRLVIADEDEAGRRSTPRGSPRRRPRTSRPTRSRAEGEATMRPRSETAEEAAEHGRGGDAEPEAEAERASEAEEQTRQRRARGARRSPSADEAEDSEGTRADPDARQAARGAFVELIVIVALAIGLALVIQAFVVKPYQIPSESMEPTLEVGQRVLVNRVIYHFGDPEIGDIVVFHPPAGRRDAASACGAPKRTDAARPATRPAEPTSTADTNFIKRVVAGPGDTLCDRGRAPDRQRRAVRGRLHQALRRAETAATCRKRSRSRPTTTS